MAAITPTSDKVSFDAIRDAEEIIEGKLECDLIHFFGEIRDGCITLFRDVLETLSSRAEKKSALGICLTTPGGQAEVVEKCVEIARYHYTHLYFIVPRLAMSAGTIFCMAGDKIYMDYSSSLGPIDPQVLNREEKYLVPALGYLDKVQELLDKSTKGSLTPAEFMLIEKLDLAMLRFYEQARELSITLLKQWLANYKFKDWTHHRTTNPGQVVTDDDKKKRAADIAELLSNNKHWHSHGRYISMKTLKETLRLDIEDFGKDKELKDAIRKYSDIWESFLDKLGVSMYVYNRHTFS
jgi:hypothetical protein